jgi:hypothetical protein
MSEYDRSKSLQELEGKDWGEPEFQSHVVTNAHRLRRVPLCEFAVEDLRLMIGQEVGLQYLIPLALEHLRAAPFIEGDCYPGDLLVSVLQADSSFWLVSPQLRRDAAEIVERALSLLPALDETEREIVQVALADAHDIFQ